MKTIIYQKKALKQLRRIPTGAEIRRKCSEELVKYPFCQNVKPLINHQYMYRFRVGNYRVMFNLVGDTMNVISVEEVKKRDERTY